MGFTIVNGQILTPGLAIVDAPQPYTPLGGDTLQVALDVSGNGKLSLDPSDDAATRFHEITIFLTSTEKEKNFTISNGTSTGSNAYAGPVLGLEPSSTVKHVNWIWPECFVGDGKGSSDSARGNYNISMHQSFRWNGTDYYTVFELPISVSNAIEKSDNRTDCSLLENDFEPAVSAASNDTLPGQPWDATGSSNVTNSPGSGNAATEARVGAKHWALFALVMAGMMVL
ncbi:hypothetical protein P175DRAFT_0480270 [Aspergillus ochraceoroseus IBT 24754]|uniref:Uncharacterized protein n=2 Tax=Aspergillus ochraceoroseus TaxID=138278 RepID=A0A2T5LU00_9EURO|nr:uncharacterized protein P175DRAFT_0480270 [Aspergillus ochraceoroseus IBT 24754]KKK14568.1 hypothetical protein AOCH_003234 [Aspergillus ochraceoroseus]PTU19766.1 hypothetical protein P175DRAFT_0480270 [Aspergillus ochraceoroseus IBT 24754]